MRDDEILALFFARSEQAIRQVQRQFGAYCFSTANRILRSREDCEECVNETWLRAWQTIPPKKPDNLKLYLASITRNLAFSRYRCQNADRRGGGEIPAILDELSECVDASATPEENMILKEMGAVINEFLAKLPERDRDVFLRRYFFAESTREIAERYGMREGNASVILTRVRKKLRKHLIREGYVYDK